MLLRLIHLMDSLVLLSDNALAALLRWRNKSLCFKTTVITLHGVL